MKHKIIFFLLFSSLLGNAQNVSVSGQLTNFQGVDSLFFKGFTNNESEVAKIKLDKNGHFSYSTQLKTAGYYRLGISDQNFLMLLLMSGDKVVINADAIDLYRTATITGSKQTTLFYDANSSLVDFQKQKDSLQKIYNEQMQLLSMKEENYAVNFIKQNLKSMASLVMVDKVNRDTHGDVLMQLDSALYMEYPANKMVQDFHTEMNKNMAINEGSQIPEIALKDRNGKIVKLSSLKGKVVLIDFWATWCGPCKAEVPNLRRIYDAYHEKGFEIYSISIDRNKQQWLDGSTDLKWISVHDDDGSVANQFNVTSIPHLIIVDRTGKIVAKNLRGAQLYLKISDMFQ